jgi:hypothetical protein
MIIKRTIVLFSSLLIFAGCSKKDSDSSSSDDEDEELVEEQPTGVLELHSAVSEEIDKLRISEYGETGLRLAEETWDADEWGLTERFNCIGECEEGHSATAKAYLDDVLNPDAGGPVGSINESMGMFCLVGIALEDHMVDGLPEEVTDEEFTFDADALVKVDEDCGMGGDIDEGLEISITVEALEDVAYDRKMTFTIPAMEETFEFYLKNTDGMVRVATLSENDENVFGRKLVEMDLKGGTFRYEEYYRNLVEPAENDQGMAGSFSFYRGFIDLNTAEVRFLSNMGSSTYLLNNTFVSVSGKKSEDEETAGAYFARTSDEGTSLDGAFVCFEKATGDFVNATGCEESDDDRKIEWDEDEELFVAVEGKEIADWDFSDEMTIVEFDAETIYTLEPTYK